MSHHIGRDAAGKQLPRPDQAHPSLFYHLYRCADCGVRDHGHEWGHQRAIHSEKSLPPAVACPSCERPMQHVVTHYADAGAAADSPENFAVKAEFANLGPAAAAYQVPQPSSQPSLEDVRRMIAEELKSALTALKPEGKTAKKEKSKAN